MAEIRIDEYNKTSTFTKNRDTKSTFDLKLEIQAETVAALNKIGYEAYDVNPQTFETVANTLNTDLTQAGLNNEGAYIITLNESGFIYPDAETSRPFNHTYNGNTYSLRWMTVRSTDDPAFEDYSYKNIMNDSGRDAIINFLDAAVGIYVGEIWKPLGTISSLLGLSIGDIWTSQAPYCIYNATSTWVRRYTQVWSDYLDSWSFGCYVEEVEAASYMNGWYYNSTTHTKEPLIQNKEKRVIPSSRFKDCEWRKDYAVLGYLTSYVYPDITGDVKYYYDGEAIITQ